MPKKIKATTLATPEPPKLEDTSESSKKKPSKGATPTTPKPDPDDKKPAAKPTKGPKHLHDFVILGTPMDVETATRAAGAADKSAVVDDKKASGRTADDGLILVDTDEDEPEPPKRNGPVDMAYSPNKKAKGGKGSRPDKILVTLFSTGMALFQHTRNDEDVEAYQYDAKEDLKLQPDESTLKKKGFLGFVQIKDKDGNKKKCKNTQYPATGFVAKPFDSPKAMKLYSKNEIKATLLKLATEFASWFKDETRNKYDIDCVVRSNFWINEDTGPVSVNKLVTDADTMQLLGQVHGDEDGNLPRGFASRYPKAVQRFFENTDNLVASIKDQLS